MALIRAAGGVVTRETPAGREVLVIHRTRHRDWSLPKGKLKRGETPAEAALREVREETGYQVELAGKIGEIRYEVRGAPKVVEFWNMRALGSPGEIADPSEVEGAVWMPPDEALARLDYPLEREILARAMAVSENLRSGRQRDTETF
jgi:8-oxo-dGTP diphosphatase